MSMQIGKIMSIRFMGFGVGGIKDLVGSYVREHSSEIVIVGVMTAVLVGVTAVATGDILQALASSRRHR